MRSKFNKSDIHRLEVLEHVLDELLLNTEDSPSWLHRDIRDRLSTLIINTLNSSEFSVDGNSKSYDPIYDVRACVSDILRDVKIIYGKQVPIKRISKTHGIKRVEYPTYYMKNSKI